MPAPAPALNKPHLSRSTAPLSSLVHMRRPLLIFLTATTTPHVLAPPKPSPPPRSGIPPRYDLDAKWDACLDLSIRRVAYASLVGAFGRPHPLPFCGEKARRKFVRPCQICASIMGIGWGPWSPVLGSYMQATLIAGTASIKWIADRFNNRNF